MHSSSGDYRAWGSGVCQISQLLGWCERVLLPPFNWGCFIWGCVCACSISQPCPTLCNLIDCSPPGSSVHGSLQARILEWVAISSSRGSSRVSCISCIGRWILYLLNHLGSPPIWGWFGSYSFLGDTQNFMKFIASTSTQCLILSYFALKLIPTTKK